MNKATRSKIMRSIRGSNTVPELIVRKLLFKSGFRYRLHSKKIKGRPDIVLPRFRAIIEVQGCFWHAHDCFIFNMPSEIRWQEKIRGNQERDKEKVEKYNELGWKVLYVWECAISGKEKLPMIELENTISNWIKFDSSNAEIRGRDKLI